MCYRLQSRNHTHITSCYSSMRDPTADRLGLKQTPEGGAARWAAAAAAAVAERTEKLLIVFASFRTL